MLLVLFACAEDPASAAPAFVVEPADLGEPRTDGTGFDPADGDALGIAFAYALPVFGDNPAWDVPASARALLEPDTISDPGSCPREEVDGDARTWIGDCRSSQGYEFRGTATERSWTEDGVDRHRWEGDIEVVGDREDPAFTRVALAGVYEQAVPVEGTVTQHLDVNLHMEVEGYWETRRPGDAVAAAWSDWTVSGSLEQRDTFWVSLVAADVGGSGGFRFDSPALDADASCPVEVVGQGALSADVAAVLEGVASCDACANLGDTLACRP
jgi:hypothetical protein